MRLLQPIANKLSKVLADASSETLDFVLPGIIADGSVPSFEDRAKLISNGEII